MSTRCTINVRLSNSNYVGIYCHHDGDPDWVGNVLLWYYNTAETIFPLIMLGDISSLEETLEATAKNAYTTSGEEWHINLSSEITWKEEFNYVFDLSTNKWELVDADEYEIDYTAVTPKWKLKEIED